MRTSFHEWQFGDGFNLEYQEGDLVGLLASNSDCGSYGVGLGINVYSGKTGTFGVERGERVPLYRSWVVHLLVLLQSFPWVHRIDPGDFL